MVDESSSAGASEVDPAEVISNQLRQLEGKRRNSEQEIERRIALLEKYSDEIKRSLPAEQFGQVIKLLPQLLQLSDKLRSLEDIELITKLEGVRTQDDIVQVQKALEEMKAKVDIVTDATKKIAAKLPEMKKEAETKGAKKVVGAEGIPVARMPEISFLPAARSFEDVSTRISEIIKRIALLETKVFTREELAAVQADLTSIKNGLSEHEKRLTQALTELVKIAEIASRAQEIGTEVAALKSAGTETVEMINSLRLNVRRTEGRTLELLTSLKTEVDKKLSQHAQKLSEDMKQTAKGLTAELDGMSARMNMTARQQKEFITNLNQKIADVNAALKDYASDIEKLKVQVLLTRQLRRLLEGEEAKEFVEKLTEYKELEKKLSISTEAQKSIADLQKRVEELSTISNYIVDSLNKFDDATKMAKSGFEGASSQLGVLNKKAADLESQTIKISNSYAELSKNFDTTRHEYVALVKREVEPLKKDMSVVKEKLAPLADLSKAVENRLVKQEVAAAQIQKSIDERIAALGKAADEKIRSEVEELRCEIEKEIGEAPVLSIKKDVDVLKSDIELMKGIRSELVSDVERILAAQEDVILKKIAFEPLKKELSEKIDKRLAVVSAAVESAESAGKELREKLAALDKIIEQRVPRDIEKAINERFSKMIESEKVASEKMAETLNHRLGFLTEENERLRLEIEKLKAAYFAVAEAARASPMVIE